MNARIARLALALVVSVSLAQCNEIACPARFTVKVMDEEGNPIPDAKVSAATFVRWQAGEGFGKDIWEGPDDTSNEEGLVTFEFKSKWGEYGLNIFPPPEGYYNSIWPKYKFEEVRGLRWKPENPTIPYVLKKKRNPIALYVKRIPKTLGAYLPEFNKKFGYDFEIGDFVHPHGSGKVNDIYFQFDAVEEGRDFQSTISITFPNEKDGLIYFEDEMNVGSEFISDYLAPEEGYENDKLLHWNRVKGIDDTNLNREKANYYLRLRTELDEDGSIKSANYAKIYGEFINFTYYFNPTPNDRNLEFDPKKNLFRNERVISP